MIRLFKTEHLNELFEEVNESINLKINKLEDHYFHADNIKNVTGSIVKDLLVKEITVDFASRKSSVKMVPSGYMPKDKVARVDYTFDFKGNGRLLGIQPNTRTFQYNIEAEVSNFDFRISYVTRYVNENLSEPVKAEVKSAMSELIRELPNMIDAINAEINTFNSEISTFVENSMLKKKVNIDLKHKQNDELNDF